MEYTYDQDNVNGLNVYPLPSEALGSVVVCVKMRGGGIRAHLPYSSKVSKRIFQEALKKSVKVTLFVSAVDA